MYFLYLIRGKKKVEDTTTKVLAQPDKEKIQKVVKQAAQQPIGQEQTSVPAQNSEPAKEVKPKLKVPAEQSVAVAQPQPTAQSAQVPTTPQSAQTPAVQQPKNKKLKWWIWLIFGLVIVGLGVGLYFWIF